MTFHESGMLWVMFGIVIYLVYRVERLTYDVEKLKESK